MLAIYTGEQMRLFRGENQDRWSACKIGMAWTPDIETARMFVRGINSNPNGGVLLESSFEREAIISGPNSHSIYLGENLFTIDPVYLANILVVEIYPPCF